MVKNLSIYSSQQRLINKKKIHTFVDLLQKELDFSIDALILNFIPSEKILHINQKYLNHNYPTDIITFDYLPEKPAIEAEIFISIDEAASNAKRYNVCFEEEIGRLIIHGILHLLGFDDKSKKNKIFMKKEENRLLNTFKFALL